MAEEKNLEELNRDLEIAISEHGEDSDEVKAIQTSIDQFEEEGKKFDYSYVRELREEARTNRIKKAEEKKKRLEAEEKLKKFENDKLSESEKKDKRIAELEKENVDIQTGYKEKEIDNLILTVASGKNFADMEVVRLLAKKELDSEEEVDQKTVEKVIDKIAKEKPYLISGEKSAASGSGNFEKKGMEGEKTPDVMMGDFLHDRE